MVRRIKNRLRSKRGESLAEVLIATLLSAVAMVMLSSMIFTSNRIVTHSKEVTQKYVTENNRIVEKKGTYREGSVSVVIGENVVKLTDGSSDYLKAWYYVNNSLSNVPVALYKKGSE